MTLPAATACSRLIRLAAPLAPRTLRGRLSLVALTTAALLMVILTVVFNTVVGHRLQREADDELRTRAAAVATTVDTRGGRVRVLETVNDRLLDTNVWIYDGTRLLERPPGTTRTDAVARAAGTLAAAGRRGCATVGGHDPVRLCAEPVPGPGTAAAIVTTLDLSPYRSSARTMLLGSFALDAVMLACTYALTRLAVGRALRPVRTMTDQATQWSAVASEERFGARGRPAELAALGASLDALLDRIRAVLRHERQLSGELSHELRTPLSRIVAELDWWSSRPRSEAETRATHEVIAEAARSMRTICDTLLDEARDGQPTAPGTAEVLPVLHRVVASLDAPGPVRVTVTGDGTPLRAGVRTALLERIVSPLLANALRHARTRVAVTARRTPDAVCVEITDDGPGVPESFTPLLFQPGKRADPGDGHGGAGLGLPLARRLARSAGGEVSHDARYRAGARFVVTLPAG
ncbi:signal transduction histidine kinase [Streptomyces griseochromogenes]|uniref:Signal transduction histidine-protein kinase/phosphatase MprB n=1 Tax=Streptomyces griseochromogenes TaxID=68214 RepID=A0A1B1AXK4_9ACTN|nr:HAMP domain-containing sensor histidine kinase [Streptomyces griseochromogenes]ANP51260.1 two-component sensor histidine kinase [Streptomyces griseochromogenes]MBP2050055.1 signal transduction histidine kinase [Streptomyces griseochromogenes]